MSLVTSLPLDLLNSPEWAQNPFRAASIYANSVVNPNFPQWALSMLTFFIIMRVGFILVCAGIMFIPVFKGSDSRKRHFYLVHRVYPEHGNGIPYLVPNRCMIIAVSELLNSVLYMLWAYFNRLYYSEVERQKLEGPTQLMMWFTIAWLPSYVGMFLATWGLCYACLCDVEGTKNKKYSRILTPIVYNSIWISWSLLAIGMVSYWAVRGGEVVGDTNRTFRRTLALLNTASISWNTHHNLGIIPIKTLLSDLDILNSDWRLIEVIVIRVATVWVMLMVSLAFFYIFVVCVLLRMLKQVLRMREADAMTVDDKWASKILCELHDEFQFLYRSSFVIFLTIGVQIFDSLLQIAISKHLDSLHWRIASALLPQLPGVFMAPALLLQSWRIFTERSTDESEFCRVPLNSSTKGIPKLTSQLLGWDTTVCWKDENDVQDANFPGLHPVSLVESAFRDKRSTSLPDDSSGECIHITRSTVITQDVI